MRYRKRSSYRDIKWKNRWKIIRTMFQILFCLGAIGVLIYVTFFPKVYMEPDRSSWGQGNGFVALSYAGVANNDNGSLISRANLDNHLKALSDAGYTTMGVEDIINYYENGGSLPEKALFLIFEDGRRDSFIFAQPILEKYNFKAAMFTYASNIKDNDRLFLKEKDLKYLEKSSYWDIGSNGYRFSYINVYKKNTEGKEDSGMKYNHYLMDYLRDEDGVPIESKSQMEQRITWDYDEMNRIYADVLGYQPKAYMIMHGNTMFNNMNAAAEKINLDNIYKHFKLMFNRQGTCRNNRNDSIYNLTRMQVQPDWTADMLMNEIEKSMERR